MKNILLIFIFLVCFSINCLSQTIVTEKKVIDKKFILINAAHLASAFLDVEITHHCISDHTCREANPLMPSSLGGQIAVDSALVGYGTFVSYKLKKQNNRLWWVNPTLGITSHTVGITITLNRKQ